MQRMARVVLQETVRCPSLEYLLLPFPFHVITLVQYNEVAGARYGHSRVCIHSY
jgi:hypothetical protein